MATFVLVHGAWQGGWAWARVIPQLRALGHDVLAPTLTGLGDRAHLLSPAVGLDTHVRDVVATLDLERLDDVVLVGHSYAGQVIAGVASVRPSAIRRLVHLDAFVPDDGDAAIDLQPPEIAGHYRESVADAGFGWLIPPRSVEVLGVTAPADVAWLRASMVPHPFRTYTDAATVTPAARELPATFVECVDWIRVFRSARETAEARGWPVRELATGHQSMTTAPAELAALLDDLADNRPEA